jgi:hypothetical protein
MKRARRLEAVGGPVSLACPGNAAASAAGGWRQLQKRLARLVVKIDFWTPSSCGSKAATGTRLPGLTGQLQCSGRETSGQSRGLFTGRCPARPRQASDNQNREENCHGCLARRPLRNGLLFLDFAGPFNYEFCVNPAQDVDVNAEQAPTNGVFDLFIRTTLR